MRTAASDAGRRPEEKSRENSTPDPWVASHKQGVWRKPLARNDVKRGHATSLVKFEAGASFTEHDHPLGKEILVLSGTFSDHTGDYYGDPRRVKVMHNWGKINIRERHRGTV